MSFSIFLRSSHIQNNIRGVIDSLFKLIYIH